MMFWFIWATMLTGAFGYLFILFVLSVPKSPPMSWDDGDDEEQ
jgi:hypothetical protein